MQPHAALRARIDEGPGQRPEVLLFDLCGVIFDNTIWSRWLFQLVSRLGLRVSYESFVCGWEQQYLIQVNTGQRDYWEAVQHYLVSLGLRRGAVDEVCVAAKAQRRRFDESIRPLPGTKAGLMMLTAGGQRLAVLGNLPCSCDEVRQRLNHLGLAEVFTSVFSSRDICCRAKPEERYRAISEELSVAPHAIWFVSASALELHDASVQGLSSVAWQLARAGKPIHNMDHLHEMIGSAAIRNHSLAG